MRRICCAGLIASASLSTIPSNEPAHAATFTPTLAWQRNLTGRIQLSSPTIADINGDGANEIVVGDLDGWVHVYRGDGAAELPGWPQRARVDGVNATAVDSSPAVADLDLDGKPEIIVGGTSVWVPNQQGGLVVFNSNGTLRWRWQGIDYITIWGNTSFVHDGYTEGNLTAPAIGDVDGDKYPDIVFGTLEAKIHALNRNGNEIRGFPYQADDTVWSSPSLYDSDKDGRMEIFVGSPSTGGGPQPHMGGTMFALDWRTNGTVATTWRNNIGESIDASPAIADINGDGRMEVVTTTSWAFSNAHSRMIWAWHLNDGSRVPGWPVDTGSITAGSVAVGDVDGNKTIDVVAGSWDGRVRAYAGSGRKIWDADAFAGQSQRVKIEGALSMADADGDGDQDIFVSADDQTMILSGRTGNVLARRLGAGVAYFNAPAIGMVNKKWSLVIAGFIAGHPVTESDPRSTGRISVFTLGSTQRLADWPMFRHDPARTGRYSKPPRFVAPWQCAHNVAAPPKTRVGAGTPRLGNGAIPKTKTCGPAPTR